VSPRSAEFLDAARRRLALARTGIDMDPAAALSLAYYAMLYAARAALSERDTYAKTHIGTWHELRRTFVKPGLFDANLVTEAQKAQPEREQADYEAWLPSEDEARRVIGLASNFLEAVESLLAEERA
jgi:uncharacterized protein (UPF0332 family)